MSESRKTLASFMLALGGTVAACLSFAASADDAPKADKPAADPMLGKEAGQVRDDNGLKMKLVWCPHGAFTIGPRLLDESVRTPSVETVHMKVVLTNGFWLGKFEVTQADK